MAPALRADRPAPCTQGRRGRGRRHGDAHRARRSPPARARPAAPRQGLLLGRDRDPHARLLPRQGRLAAAAAAGGIGARGERARRALRQRDPDGASRPHRAAGSARERADGRAHLSADGRGHAEADDPCGARCPGAGAGSAGMDRAPPGRGPPLAALEPGARGRTCTRERSRPGSGHPCPLPPCLRRAVGEPTGAGAGPPLGQRRARASHRGRRTAPPRVGSHASLPPDREPARRRRRDRRGPRQGAADAPLVAGRCRQRKDRGCLARHAGRGRGRRAGRA